MPPPKAIRPLTDFFPDRPIELEIGSGKGLYILARAAADPGWGFVAIEVRGKHARVAEERARKRGLANILVLEGDALRMLPALGPDGCLARVSVHFPDPWWKRRHEKRAVLTPGTLDGIVRLLAPGAEIYVQTDVFDRAERLLRLLTDHALLENASPGGGLLDAPPVPATSSREQKCLDAGLPVFRMLFRRTPSR